MSWHDAIGSLLGLATLILGGWLGSRIVTPRDAERAALLAQIANDAAALIVAFNPNAEWPDMLRDLVARIRAAAGVPTRNATAIENAAAAALVRLGKGPASGKP